MKTKKIFLFASIGLLMTGCFIKSLHPFYTNEDIVYDSSIIGTWLDTDSSKWIIKQTMKGGGPFGPITPENSYHVDISEKKGEKGQFNVHLFMLNNQLYLDFYPIGNITSSDFIEGSIVLTHSLAKIEYTNSEIKIQWFNEIWFGELLKQNKIRIKHEIIKEKGYTEASYLLTASTEELQKFIIKYGNDSLAFKSIWEDDKDKREEEALTFNLKRISHETD